jgi:pilus assembly protein FimV
MVLSPKRTLRVARVNIPVSLLRLVTAAAFALPVLAHAAGLGRLTVQSSLGQPLRAEIEIVSIQAGEESSLEARLASGNAFAQAGIDFNPALNGVQFALDKRDGKPTVRVSTRQPVNEPFLDLLVELRWATGLFVREYTILLDPPGYQGPKPQPAAAAPAATAASAAPAAAQAPVSAPSPAAAERAPSTPTTSEITPAPRVEERPMESPAAAQDKPAAPAEAKPAAAAETKPATEQAPVAAAAPAEQVSPARQAAQTYEVKKGDTLGEIALRYRPAGVTFHQMLIALQRANEDAFIRDNINLVRAGRILSIPDAETAAAVEPADASRLVIAQHSDFAEYRSRLAAAVATAPAAPQPAEQKAAGPITAQPEAPKPAAPSDQLKLSRADGKKPGAAQSKSAREDDLAAKQRALQESQSRVSDLEKNVADLQKLLEIQNQQLAQLQQKSAKPAPAVPGPAAKAPETQNLLRHPRRQNRRNPSPPLLRRRSRRQQR